MISSLRGLRAALGSALLLIIVVLPWLLRTLPRLPPSMARALKRKLAP